MTFDLFPTFAALGKVASLDANNLDGLDLRPTLFKGNSIPERTVFWRMGTRKAARKDSWKLCVQGEKPAELYNLADDLGEKQNLAKEHPATLSALAEALAAWEINVDKSATAFQ